MAAAVVVTELLPNLGFVSSITSPVPFQAIVEISLYVSSPLTSVSKFRIAISFASTLLPTTIVSAELSLVIATGWNPIPEVSLTEAAVITLSVFQETFQATIRLSLNAYLT